MSISDKEFQKLNDAYQKLAQENDGLILQISELHERWRKLWQAAVEINSSRVKLIVKFCNDIGELL